MHKDQTAQVTDLLSQVLVDLIALGTVIKQGHWNVVGPHFMAVHLQLDSIRADVDGLADEVAERARALGEFPNGQISDLSFSSVSELDKGMIHDTALCKSLEETFHKLITNVREKLVFVETSDPVTADLLHQVLANLEKHHWMLKAQIPS